MEQASTDYRDTQERLSKLQKQLETKDRHLNERNRQIKQVHEYASPNVHLRQCVFSACMKPACIIRCV